ncbi:MAG TPA: HAMP domain-containing sensor histidine kinase, partial [Polyangiaceae bacterium LLY-WYZ-15_(1-7)]|nr:HAMP domain-containing sensor histidine kinase [Polyangiaceae bacterium LLY-WYZ-15_(1-7)]
MKSADLHAFFLAPFLDLAAEQLGEARVRELLEEQGIELELLRDPSAWLSMKDSERIVRTLHEAVGDPLYVARAARAAFTARYMGPLRAIIRAFGNTGKAYEQMVRSLPRFNKVGELGFEQVGPRHVRLTYRQKPGAAAETDPLMCLGRQQNMAAVPTIFDLPPAKLEHPECMHRGDDACVYEIRYVERLPKFRSRLALLLGAGAGVAAALTLELGPLALGVGTVLGAFASWALVRQWELRQELGESQRLVIEQQDALERSTLANEQRFGELLEAKSGVERKVKERTSELLETSARLQQTLDEVRDLAQAKTDFFANVSHELRTPLTLLLSPLEALRRGEAPPGGPEQALETMEANAKRLLRLINQLLDLAKVDAGRATVQRAPVDAGQLVHALVSPAQALAVTQGVALSVETPERSAPVALDPTWMETALGNLLANALRFAESAVTVRFRDAGGELVFEVEDDGPGVPAEDRERIFERFSQASDAARRRGGTGLGLALVQEAARLHGGRAELDEGAGGGALFRLVLPRIVA